MVNARGASLSLYRSSTLCFRGKVTASGTAGVSGENTTAGVSLSPA